VRALAIRQQVFRFLVSGVLATAFHAAIATALIEFLDAKPVTANVAAFSAATILSYLVNTLWSFSSSVSRTTLTRFWIVALLGGCLTAGVSGAVDAWGGHYLIGIACVVMTVPPVTFALHRRWTYR
jgi:putative flippase GtrA